MVVQWDVALTKDRDRVWITDITDDWDEALFCPECDGVMIPVRGPVRQHHFRHSVESNCSGESAMHWAKKYEIKDALDGIGTARVEKGGAKIGNYVADVLFEDEWAFEVVVSNPPSEEKLRDLRENLVVFNFKDETIWSPDGNPERAQFHDYDDQSFKGIVSSLGRSIVSGETVDVCSVCREVKGASSRLKAGGKCMKCDFEEFMEMRAGEEAEENETPRRRKLSKRENELLQLTKQHLAIRYDSHGETAFEYGLLDGPKGGNRTSDPISDYGMGDPDLNASVLSEYPKIIERGLYRRIESDLVEQGLAEWVCRKCMGHHKTYRDCPNAKCDYTNWLKNEERRINRGYDNKRFGKKKRDQYLEELREREEHNPSTTEYCSLCSVLLQEHSVQNNGVVKTGRWPYNFRASGKVLEEVATLFRNSLPENMGAKLTNQRTHILYAEPLTRGQVEELFSNVCKHVNDHEMFTKTGRWKRSDAAATLGLNQFGAEITPSQFYSTISPEIVCPKCTRRDVGGRQELSYTPGCDCNQGKVASDCETCEGGMIRPDMGYLHLKLNCDCSTEPACTGHRWTLRLLVTPTNDDPNQLSIICACCGFKVFGDDYIVGDRIREFWICRSANRMLTDSEYEELLYARHGCELEDWFSNGDPWRDYIDG